MFKTQTGQTRQSKIQIKRVASPELIKKDHPPKINCFSPVTQPTHSRRTHTNVKPPLGKNNVAIKEPFTTPMREIPLLTTLENTQSRDSLHVVPKKGHHKKTESMGGCPPANSKKAKQAEFQVPEIELDIEFEEEMIDGNHDETAINSVRETLKLTSISKIKEMQRDIALLSVPDSFNTVVSAASSDKRKRCISFIDTEDVLDPDDTKLKRRISYFRFSRDSLHSLMY